MALISLAEYAAARGLDARALRQKAAAGRFKTAVKIGRNWAIDSEEPFMDQRIKSGQYVDAGPAGVAKPFRVGLMQDFPHEDPVFVYFHTVDKALALMRKMFGKGFQSEQVGNIPGVSNIAVLEQWDEEEQEWLFYH